MLTNSLRRLLFRILDKSSWIDYFWLCLLATIPVVLAWHLDIHRNHEIDGTVYLGYWVKTNMWPMVVMLPLLLFILRWLFGRMAPISHPEMRQVPPLIKLLKSPRAQREAYKEMRHYLSSPAVVLTILLLTLVVHFLDMSGLIKIYLFDSPVPMGEHDWSVMYLTGTISKAENLLFVFFAYVMQFVAFCVRIAVIVLLFAHNLFFLSRIYLRSRVREEVEENFIVIDPLDVDRCFGMRAANDAFNTQIWILTFFGASGLLSRYNSVYVEGANLTFANFFVWPLSLPDINLFPEIGQWVLALLWLIALATISMSALVKLLPRINGIGDGSELSISTYLQEFFPPNQWPYGDNSSTKDIELLAARFAENDFWPTGNNRASQLFFFSFWVFLIILVPIQTKDTLLLVTVILLLGVMAYVLRSAIFWLLNVSLSYVDRRLTERHPELLLSDEAHRIRISGKVFISYRRDGTCGYARLVHKSLIAYASNEQIFLDRLGIEDGDDFFERIVAAILDCDVLLVIIGPSWAQLANAEGLPRIMQPSDYVRMEIETALDNNRKVIPVLVGGAQMPQQTDLPASLYPMLRKHARELSDSRWEYDIEELASAVSRDETNI
jgi:hypothetical protein